MDDYNIKDNILNLLCTEDHSNTLLAITFIKNSFLDIDRDVFVSLLCCGVECGFAYAVDLIFQENMIGEYFVKCSQKNRYEGITFKKELFHSQHIPISVSLNSQRLYRISDKLRYRTFKFFRQKEKINQYFVEMGWG